MDAAKLLPMLIVAGCVAWYAYDKYNKDLGEGAEGLLGQSRAQDCAAVDEKDRQIGGPALTENERLQQACRLHVCGLSFLHGSSVVFAEITPESTTEGADKVLADSLSVTSDTGTASYAYRCYVEKAALSTPGRPAVKSVSMVQQ